MTTYTGKYRYVRNISDEGPEFFQVLQEIADFYTKNMKGQVRHDGPDTLIKYSRDWEYPWVFIKSEIQPGYKVLDCGAGFSPVPFIWSKHGAESHAIDRDILICSRFMYMLRWLPLIISNVVRLAPYALQLLRGQKPVSRQKQEVFESEEEPDINNHRVASRGMEIIVKAFRHTGRIIMRTWRPDFWGPISPELLRKYSVDYRKGDITSLPYKDGEFDVVSCVSVLEHMVDKDQVKGIREMSRVVKKGAKLIITYDKHEDLTDRFIEASGMTPAEIVYFTRPDNLYSESWPDIVGICLVK